jgi:hypothetical protein
MYAHASSKAVSLLVAVVLFVPFAAALLAQAARIVG